MWFDGCAHTDLTREMESYILGASIYGDVENRVALSQIKQGGRFKYLLGRIFLPYNKLNKIYPRLKKYPILLPFYQIKRWCRFVFRKMKWVNLPIFVPSFWNLDSTFPVLFLFSSFFQYARKHCLLTYWIIYFIQLMFIIYYKIFSGRVFSSFCSLLYPSF